MKTIYKYPIPIRDVAEQTFPKGAKILSVGIQSGELFAWAEVDTAVKERVVRKFRVAGTGHPLEINTSTSRFLGTVLLEGGSLVFHVFELKG